MAATPTIRDAGIADIASIQTLARQIWPITYGEILTATQLDYMLDLIYSTASLKRQMLEQQHHFLLCELQEDAVGFASFSETSDPAVYKLQKLYVRTDIQGKGLGLALINAVSAIIAGKKASSLLLNVNRHNKAIGFYEKHGFRIIKEEDIDIGNGYFMNDYVMEKQL